MNELGIVGSWPQEPANKREVEQAFRAARKALDIVRRVRAGHCVEHDRPLEVCGRLAWADYGQLLFDNCVRDE